MANINFQQLKAPELNTDYIGKAGNLFKQATSGLGNILTQVADEKRSSASNSFDAEISNANTPEELDALRNRFLDKQLPGSDYLNPKTVMQGFDDKLLSIQNKGVADLKRAAEIKQLEADAGTFGARQTLAKTEREVKTAQLGQTLEGINRTAGNAKVIDGYTQLGSFKKADVEKYIKDSKADFETANQIRTNAAGRRTALKTQQDTLKQEQATNILNQYASGELDSDQTLTQLSSKVGSAKAVESMYSLRNGISLLAGLKGAKAKKIQTEKEAQIDNRMQSINANIAAMDDQESKQRATSAVGKLTDILKFSKDETLLREIEDIGGMDEIMELLSEATSFESNLIFSDQQFRGSPKLANLFEVLDNYKRGGSTDDSADIGVSGTSGVPKVVTRSGLPEKYQGVFDELSNSKKQFNPGTKAIIKKLKANYKRDKNNVISPKELFNKIFGRAEQTTDFITPK